MRRAWSPAARRPSRRRARPGRQRRDRIDHEHVDRARAHEGVGDLEALLAGVGLRDQEVVELTRACGIDGSSACSASTKAQTPPPSGLRDGVSAASSCRGFGAVDLDDAAARQAADAERDVEAERARRTPSRSRPAAGPCRGA
jgi:hypothetical protein